jgi:hypothetical protein
VLATGIADVLSSADPVAAAAEAALDSSTESLVARYHAMRGPR